MSASPAHWTALRVRVERMSILDWLGLGKARRGDEGDGDVIHRIVRDLESMDPATARYLALFAFLLARVANVDQDITDDETREMERIVEAFGGLPAAQAALVVQIAKSQNRLFGETQNFLAARELRDLATEDQKRDLLHCLFAVSAADDSNLGRRGGAGPVHLARAAPDQRGVHRHPKRLPRQAGGAAAMSGAPHPVSVDERSPRR